MTIKKICFLIALFVACQAGAQTISLVGKWKASQKGDMVYLIFGEDSTFMLKHERDSLGGKSFMFGDGLATSAFKVDTSFKPIHIDMLIIQTASGAVINQMKGIFEVINPGKIRLRMSKDAGDRPNSFLPKGNEETLIFVKQ